MKIDITQVRKIAGMSQQEDSFMILETVEFGPDATIEDVSRMMDAAKRALSIAHRLVDPIQKKRHFGKILGGMNKIRAYLKRLMVTTQ